MTAVGEALDLSRLAATAAPAGLFLLDPSGAALWVNGRLAAILGVREELLLGPALAERLLGETRAASADGIAEAFALDAGADAPAVSEHRIAHREGAAEWVRVVASVARDGSGAAVGTVGLVEDVSRAHAAQAVARETEGARERARRLEGLGRLAGGIAHDFNNLLVGIVGNATLAELDVAAGSDAAAALEDLRLAAARATDLTAQLLAFAGRGALPPQPVDLTAAVEAARAAVAGHPATVRLAGELAPALPHVTGDPARLRAAVEQLLINAIEACGESGGTVTVRTGTTTVDEGRRRTLTVDGGLGAGTHVFVEVADTGTGIGADLLDRVFEPFHSTKPRRRGLGLAAVAGTVRAYRAGLEARSTVGAGTVMRLLLPIDPVQPASAPLAATAAGACGEAAAILVVDDESAVRDVTRRLLSRQGYEVLEAASGPEAIEVVAAAPDRIRCVLLDLSMPGMDGSETFRRLREIVPTLRVVLTSGHSERELESRLTGSGISGFLQKPFDFNALLRATRAALAS